MHKISGLDRQVKFLLIPRLKDKNGKTVQPTYYRADFVYTKDGEYIVEDFKGALTDVYKLKKKLMLEKHGITITETRKR